MATGTLDLEFVGNASGLVDAVNASQRALMALERNTSSVSSSLGRILRTIVAPIAGVILSAFAAKRALADFANSGLPGAAQFAGAMARMRGSMRGLSEAVGELLAPVAQRTALIISAIADRMAPLVRILTAFIAASGPFLKQLGQNFLTALAPLLPQVFSFFRRIMAFWNGINWGGAMVSLQVAWNRAWAAILEFVAPIIIALSSLIETFILVARAGFQLLVEWLQSVLPSSANAASAVQTVIDAIQFGLLTAIVAVDVALQNLPLLWDLVKTAGLLAFQVLMDNWRGFGQFLMDVFSRIGENIQTIFNNVGSMIWDALAVVGRNIREMFSAIWDFIAANLILKMGKAGMQMALGLLQPIKDHPVLATLILGVGGKALADKAFASIDSALKKMPESAGFVTPEMESLGIDPSRVTQGVKGLPNFAPAGSAEQDRLAAALDAIKSQVGSVFGKDIAAGVADAMAKSPAFIAKIGANLPNVNAVPSAANLVPQTAGAALQFGTAAAFSAENARKNPLEEKADKQIALTQQQLVEQRAANKAAQRKFRIASI